MAKDIISNYSLFAQGSSYLSLINVFKKDKNLSDGAIICWQALFELVKNRPTLAIQISKRELSNLLHKSVSTVVRHLNDLEKNGFIAREQNKNNNAWSPSKIFVNFPDNELKKDSSKNDYSYSKKWYRGGVKSDSRANAILPSMPSPDLPNQKGKRKTDALQQKPQGLYEEFAKTHDSYTQSLLLNEITVQEEQKIGLEWQLNQNSLEK